MIVPSVREVGVTPSVASPARTGTLQDGTQPLTVNEWEEFGNPNERDGHTSVLEISPVQTVPNAATVAAASTAAAFAATASTSASSASSASSAAAEGPAARRGFPRALLLPALNDARTGYWEALKYADAIRSEFDTSDAPVLVRTDMEGGHFRAADPEQRADLRALELGFVLDALLGVSVGAS